MRAAFGAILLGACVVSCAPGPGPTKEARPHPYFPIFASVDGGYTTHVLGSTTDAGEQVKCTSCHALTNTTYSKFQCVGCHEHSREIADPKHVTYAGYTYTSAACYQCHPGDARAPDVISVGGFAILQPPADDGGLMQSGIDNLPHPAAVAGLSCTSCHAKAAGGRAAFGYDHALAPQTRCAACHEAGSDLIGAPWILNAPDAGLLSAQCGSGGGLVADRGGDTRPIGIVSLACSSGAASLTCGAQSCSLNHFYPSDCSECHAKPTDIPATVQTGSSYLRGWGFQHFFAAPALRPQTCCNCHAPPSCSG